MVERKQGDIFLSTAQVLVNPVNCVGVMGAGLAKQFAQQYPGCLKPYQQACRAKFLKPGKVLGWKVPNPGTTQWILQLPTKRHWKQPSRMDDVVKGIQALRTWMEEKGVTSAAVPPLGCGLGGLDAGEVRKAVEQEFGETTLRVEWYGA